MKKAYQSPEIHRVELTPMPDIDLANASDEELSAAMKAGLYFVNKVCYQQNREFKICELLGRTVLMPVKRDAEQISRITAIGAEEKFLWGKLSKRRTKADLVDLLAAEQGREGRAVEADVNKFIKKAIEENLIIRCDME